MSGRLSTLDTVATDTPACAATSLMLTGTFTRFSMGRATVSAVVGTWLERVKPGTPIFRHGSDKSIRVVATPGEPVTRVVPRAPRHAGRSGPLEAGWRAHAPDFIACDSLKHFNTRLDIRR